MIILCISDTNYMIPPDSLSPEAHQAFEVLQGENGRLEQVIRTKDQIIELQNQKIRLLNFQLWGPKGDPISPAQTALLFEEASVTAAEIETEASPPPAQKENPLPRAKRPHPNHPGREKLPEHLERREVMIPCHPDDCRCDQCGAERPVIGYERSEELVCEPATFHVRVTLREKRGSHYQEEQGAATAPAPAKIVPKSKLANEFIIEALARNYQQHTPVYRQCAMLADDHGIDLSRTTLTAGILAAGGLLTAVVRAQADELRRSSYLQVPCRCPTSKRPTRLRSRPSRSANRVRANAKTHTHKASRSPDRRLIFR